MKEEKKRETRRKDESESERERERNIQEYHIKGVAPLRETKVEEHGGRRERRRRGRT